MNDPGARSKAGLSPEQRDALPPFVQLRAFEAMGTYGGVRRAAQALSVDHAAISRHLRALELWTGASLIDRTSGGGRTLTEEGRRYHECVARAFRLIESAGVEISKRGDQRTPDLVGTPAPRP